jgi:hypothetical protein
VRAVNDLKHTAERLTEVKEINRQLLPEMAEKNSNTITGHGKLNLVCLHVKLELFNDLLLMSFILICISPKSEPHGGNINTLHTV